MLPLERLRAVAACQAQSGAEVELIVLFGSLVRGQARTDSDADIGILGGGFWQQLELGGAIASELGREPHVVDLKAAPTVLAYEIAKTGVPLYERERFSWARFGARAASAYFDFQPAHERLVAAAKQRLIREARSGREGKVG